MRSLICAAALAVCLTSQALAAFDLQITEIWMGNAPDENLTDDWFEVTNFGDMPWTAATDGDLYYEDDSLLFSLADLTSGISSIAPGESVVFVNGSATLGGLNLFIWHDVWDPALAAASRPLPQVGTFDGSGLGQGGDTVGLFLDANSNGPEAAELYTQASYPNANAFGGQSFDSFFDVFTSINMPSAAVTIGSDLGQPAVGTPGYLLPEPTSLAMLGLGLFLVGFRRERL
jgi:hypothetical protein